MALYPFKKLNIELCWTFSVYNIYMVSRIKTNFILWGGNYR